MAKAKTKSTAAKAGGTKPAKLRKSATGGKSRPDADPASPGKNEVSDTADLATARVLANIGAPGTGVEEFALAATSTTLAIDIAKVAGFLKACMTSSPRVTYGLGAKVPFYGAVPGKDFTKVDCSGFVREAIRRATNKGPFPDGSVVQHDFIREKGFATSTIADAGKKDGIVRIAFLRPQDAASGIGHVVIVHRGVTYESHGGTGPNSRDWTGTGWQEKAKVYILSSANESVVAGSTDSVLLANGATFTVRKGHRYRATVILQGLEQFAGNDRVADELKHYGFTDVRVTGGGRTRTAEATWDGPDTTAQIDPHLTNVVELETDPA